MLRDTQYVTHINCGTVGLANLEKHHGEKKVCQENKAKHAKEELQSQKQKRNGSLLDFFKRPKTTHIPSTVSNPEPIHSNSFAPEKDTDMAAVTATNTQCEGAVSPSKPEVEPASSSFLGRFQLVLFRPGLASKPRLWLGLRRLWLSQHTGQAKAVNQGLALAWPGPGHGFCM